MSTSDRTIHWIENLAEQESSIQSGERSSIDIGLTKGEVLSKETSHFLRELFYHFDYLVKLFNLRLNSDASALLISRSESQASEGGFSLQRNFCNLSILCFKPGTVQLHCEKLIEPGENTQSKTILFNGTILAEFGQFYEVGWRFLNEPISAEQLARHYLTEFIQVSRKPNSSSWSFLNT
jgi:hypothetical protein